jgi:hypothetical protein
MGTSRVGIREFRDKLATYLLESDTLAVRLAVPTIRDCKGLSPSSLRRCHHSTFACAYALRAMLGAPKIRPGPEGPPIKLLYSGAFRLLNSGL